MIRFRSARFSASVLRAFEKFVVVVVLLRRQICDRALSLSRPCGLCDLGWFGCCLSALNGALLPRGMTSLWLGHDGL